MARGKRDRSEWPDFTATAWRQFLSLPNSAQDELVSTFPEFVAHPIRPSLTLDIVPLRDDPERWRLKITGFRVLYRVRQGRALIEEIEPRTVDTYLRFGRFVRSRPP